MAGEGLVVIIMRVVVEGLAERGVVLAPAQRAVRPRRRRRTAQMVGVDIVDRRPAPVLQPRDCAPAKTAGSPINLRTP